MFNILLTLVAAYAMLVGFLYFFQRHLMYFPDKNIESPGYYGLADFSETFITTPDHVAIQLWYHAARPGFPTIIYYHGNAYNMGSRAGIYGALAGKGFGVLAVSYRGYGKSGGYPSERGLYNDARAAIDFLTDQQHIPLSRIVLYGESLGTGVAVQMASEYKVAALILQAPYTSVVQRASEIYRYVPVRLMIEDHYDSLSKIGSVKIPLLLFHGEKDTVIPIIQGQTLFAAANTPKQAFFFPQFSHNDFDSAILSAHVLNSPRNIISSSRKVIFKFSQRSVYACCRLHIEIRQPR